MPALRGHRLEDASRQPGAPKVGSKDRRVTRCDCQLRARTQTLLAAARIPKRYEHCELASYTADFPGAHPSLAFAHLSASRFAQEYDPRDGTGLLIIGKIGTGKTHLAVGITKDLILNKGISCLFYDYRELLKEIQNSYNATVQTTELDVLRPVFETDVLVLDELGAVKPTEWVWDTVSLILNTRYNDNRTTIITTNFEDQPAAGANGSISLQRAPPRAPKLSATASASACAPACMKCAASSRWKAKTSARNSAAPAFGKSSARNLLRHDLQLREGATMRWYHYISYFFGGVFLANALPHLGNGISGHAFQSPFASPPGLACPLRWSMSRGASSTLPSATCSSVVSAASICARPRTCSFSGRAS